MTKENMSEFNKSFFKKIEENSTEDYSFYLNDICEKYNITNNQEIRALIIFFYWNYYLEKLFPNLIIRRIKKDKDPRVSSVFKYCYKLQKETNGILSESEYKDYVFCQIKFLKSYIEKTNKPVQVTPNILNVDKAWKKWKYFKYILSKSTHTISAETFVNNDILKNLLKKDRIFIESKIKISIDNIKKHSEQIYFWNKIGNISVYFMAFNFKNSKKNNKDYSVYKFDETGKKLFNTIFPELR